MYLQAARIETGLARERPVDLYHFLAKIVENVHVKITNATSPPSAATAAYLGRVVHFLADRILNNVLVVSFPPSNHCK